MGKWTRILDQFETWKESSDEFFPKEEKLDIADQTFIRKVGRTLNLELKDAFNFCKLCLGPQFLKENLDKKTQIYSQSNVLKVLNCYFDERLSSIRILSQILKSSVAPSHWFHHESKELAALLLEESDFSSKLLQKISNCSRMPVPTHLLTSEVESIYKKQALKEEESLSELYLWSILQFEMSPVEKLPVLENLVDYLNSKTSASISVGSNRNVFLLASFVQLLDLPTLGDFTLSTYWTEVIKTQHAVIIEMDRKISKLASVDIFGFVHAVWASFIIRYMDRVAQLKKQGDVDLLQQYFEAEPASLNQPPLFVQYAQKSIGSISCLNYLLSNKSFLSNLPDTRTIVLTIFLNGIGCFLTGFELKNLPLDSKIGEFFANTIRPEVIANLNVNRHLNFIGNVFDYYVNMFPAYKKDFYSIAIGLCDVSEAFPILLKSFSQLNSFCMIADDVDTSAVSISGDNIIKSILNINVDQSIFKRTRYQISPNTSGTYIKLPKAGAVVLWKMNWTSWDYFEAVLYEYSSRIKDTKLIDSELEHICDILDFLSSVAKNLTKNILLVDRETCRFLYESFFPKILDINSRMFEMIIQSHHAYGSVVSRLLNVYASCSSLIPEKTLTSLNNANLLNINGNNLNFLIQNFDSKGGESFLNLLDQLLLKVHRSSYEQMLSDLNDDINFYNLLHRFVDFFLLVMVVPCNGRIYRTKSRKFVLEGKILGILDLILSDNAPLLALNSKKEKTKNGSLAKYGAIISSAVDTILGEQSEKLVSTFIDMIPATPSFLEDCNQGAYFTTANVETCFKILQSLLIINSQRPDGFALESLLVSSNMKSDGESSLLSKLVSFIGTGISHSLTLRASQLLCQLTERVSHWKPRIPSLSTMIKTSIVIELCCLKLDDTLPTVQSAIIRFASLCLKSQPGIALELTLSSEEKELSSFLKKLVKIIGSSQILNDSPEVVSAALNFLAILFSIGSSFSQSINQLNSSSEFIQSISLLLEKLTSISSSIDDAKGYHRNVILSHLYEILSCSVIISKGKTTKDPLNKYISTVLCDSKVKDYISSANGVHLEETHKKSISMVAENPHVDLDIFRQHTWSKRIHMSIDFGRLYNYNVRALRNTQPEVASELEFINMNFSLCDSQILVIDAYWKLLQVSLRCHALTSFNAINFLQEFLRHVFQKPKDEISKKLVFKSGICLIIVLNHCPQNADQIISYLQIATSLLMQHDFLDIIHDVAHSKSIYLKLFTILHYLFDKLPSSSSDAGGKYAISLIQFFSKLLSTVLPRGNIKTYKTLEYAVKCLDQSIKIASSAGFGRQIEAFLNNDDTISRLLELALSEAQVESFSLHSSVLWCLSRIAANPCSHLLLKSGILGKLPMSPLASLIKNHVSRGSPMFDFYQEVYSSILNLYAHLLKAHGSSQSTVYDVIYAMDFILPNIHETFEMFGKESVTSDRSLENLCAISDIIFFLSRNFTLWKHRFVSFGEDLLSKSLLLTKSMVELLLHQNRFAEYLLILDSSNNALSAQNTTSDSKESPSSNGLYRRVHTKFFRIIRNIYFAAYTMTEGWQTILNPPHEWRDIPVVLVPALETSVAQSNSVSLGTLNILIAYCRDRLESGLKKLTSDEKERREYVRLLCELVESTFLLYLSQMIYSLGSNKFDMRQKEQIRAELGGEIVAAIDAYSERFVGSSMPKNVEDTILLLKRLKNILPKVDS